MSKPSKNRTLCDDHDLHEPTDGYDCYEDMMDMIKLSLLAAMFDKAMMAMIKINCFKKKLYFVFGFDNSPTKYQFNCFSVE